ncbi:DUF6233 domain-containing protein [Streptomyces sp. NPDC059922]|uniref:DUF6233 domain-containing protein n=1 Tax=Streptomyces sp. NPDC059922 TaxID=3347005 RepID=UPI00364A579B
MRTRHTRYSAWPPTGCRGGSIRATAAWEGPCPGCTRDEARRMLADGVEACPYCNPDVAPGLL